MLRNRKIGRIAARALRWHLDYYRGRMPKPMAVGLFTTNRCNLKCSMCSIWRDPAKATLSYDRLRTLVELVTPGCCYFSFSGGEPLLVREIDRMIAAAAAKIPYIHLVSNGLLVDEATARMLQAAGLSEISLSLDGGPDWHNTVRGGEESHSAVINAVECLKSAAPKIRIVLNTVLFPSAVEEARRAVATARRLEVKIKIQPVNRHFQFPAAGSLPKEVDFSRADHQVLAGFIEECVRERRVVNSRFFLRHIPSYFTGRLDMPAIVPKCLLPYIYLECDPHGRISPCMVATGWESGVTIEDLADPAKIHQYRELQRRLESCRQCNRSMYICCWEPMINFPLSHFLKYGLRG